MILTSLLAKYWILRTNMKEYTRCKIKKSLDSFSKRKMSKDGLQSRCKKCMDIIYTENKEQISINRKIRYKENREEELLKVKIYSQDPIVKQKRKLKGKALEAFKYRNDPIFKCKKLLRSRQLKAIKRGTKTGSAVKDLGCTVKFFVNEYIPSLS